MPSRHEALSWSFIEAFNRHDAARLIAVTTEDFEIRPLRALLEGIVYRGPAGIEQWLADVRESWSELFLDGVKLSDVSEDTLLVDGTFHARGRATDMLTEVPVIFVARIRDGRVASVTTFLDRDEAVRLAAGQT
jgi:ketosteroid isomerase-like protein